jgi:putative inorganic carbon (HCO3(-)) transporter
MSMSMSMSMSTSTALVSRLAARGSLLLSRSAWQPRAASGELRARGSGLGARLKSDPLDSPGHGLWSLPRVGLTAIARALLIAGIAWGAFAFGAVYPWAYWPLTMTAAAVAVAGLAVPAAITWRSLDLTGLTIALAVFLLAATAQLVPLPTHIVHTMSPAAPAVVAQLDLTAQLGLETSRPLSIDPAGTLRGLVVLASLSALIVGASRLLSIAGAHGTARAIAILGVLLALTGIIQQPLFTGKIYGFWLPQQGGNPFGPFVNRNHFAGWMLMALPVTIGLLCGDISRGLRGVRPEWRDRIVWLSSAEASRLMLVTGAVAIMTLSLILAMSRSGMAAGALAITGVVLAMLASRRHGQHDGRAKRVAAVAIVSALLVLAIGWVGVGTIVSRFANGNPRDLDGRVHVWQDTIDIARQYPVAGTGLNTYGVSMLFYQRVNPSLTYTQAHNDYLQLASEGGLLLSIPAALCVVVFVRAVRRRFAQETSASTYWIRVGAVIGLVAIALQEIVEFSLQMPGNAFLFAVLCAIALHRTPARRACPPCQTCQT